MDTALAVKQNGNTAIAQADLFHAMADQLKYMIVNGSKLNDAEVHALAQYATTNELNPFNGECYYLPGKGPVPGIIGWRKKAQEQLDWEAQRENTQAHMWIEEREATQEEAKHEQGDYAIHVTLHDWLSNKRWRRDFFETMKELKAIGYNHQEAMETAKAMVGPEPTWTGIGVVYKSESFAASGGVDKMSRHERAAKRAEKIALRKRFPRVNLPDLDLHDTIDGQYSDTTPTPPLFTETTGSAAPQESADQLLAELGFAPSVTVTVTELQPDNQPGPEWQEQIVDRNMPEPEKEEQPALPLDWDAAMIDAIAAKFELHRNHVIGTLKFCKLPKNVKLPALEDWMTEYKAQRGNDKTPQEAAQIANDMMMGS